MNELEAYARGASRMDLVAAQAGPDPSKFVPTNDLPDESSSSATATPPGAAVSLADYATGLSTTRSLLGAHHGRGAKGGDGSGDSTRGGQHQQPRAGLRVYFAASGDAPDLLYLQAGGWDRAMGCLSRRDFALRLSATLQLLSLTAPGAAVVLGTLPTGTAYPPDPRREMARLQAMETKDQMKERVVLCLK